MNSYTFKCVDYIQAWGLCQWQIVEEQGLHVSLISPQAWKMQLMTALILINPHAAGGRAQQLVGPIQAWSRELPPHHNPPQIVVPDSIEKALEVLSRLPPQTRVVIVGGDGTLNQMLPGLLQGRHSVGLVPYGSGNDCARAWGLHRMTWQQALAFALEGTTSEIDVGRVVLDHNNIFYFQSNIKDHL